MLKLPFFKPSPKPASPNDVPNDSAEKETSIASERLIPSSAGGSEKATGLWRRWLGNLPGYVAGQWASDKKLDVVALVRSPGPKSFALLGALGATAGLAASQIANPQRLATLLPAPDSAPLSRPGDPPAESILSARHLFLTNQILYRKIEALAQVPNAQIGSGQIAESPSDQASNQTSNQANKPASASSGKTASPNKGSNAAAVSDADLQAQQAEQVVAATPPAPQVEQPVFTGTTIDNVLEMRVAVAKDVSALSFATSNGGVIVGLDGAAIQGIPAETSMLTEINGGVVVDGQSMPEAFWVYPEDGGYVAVGDSWYRGRVLVALRERGLIAVNYVLLGDYLYSVVGTEMSADWPIEALKAQAVAARSYALTHNIHPASETYFDLDNTQRFQAYKGIFREANTTQAAVQATAGEFISHEGGIVESLYAASQAIVDDAHSGSGMSQLGAKDLASQGYSYAEILGYYYPDTGLGRIETDSE